MALRFKTNLKATHSLIDLTPLVDVIFLMLIFFIITSDIPPLKSLNIDNPTLDKDSSPLTTQLAQHAADLLAFLVLAFLVPFSSNQGNLGQAPVHFRSALQNTWGVWERRCTAPFSALIAPLKNCCLERMLSNT